MPNYYYQDGVYGDPLADLYPPVYGVIYPRVRRKLDDMYSHYGDHYVPSQEHFNSMIDDIYNTEEENIKNNYEERVLDRQWHGRPFLRDLIALSLLSELLERRRFGHGHDHDNFGHHFHNY